MTHMDKKAQLSDFIDTAEGTHVLDEVLADAHLQRTWLRYHLIGETLRGKHCDAICRMDICTQVSTAIEGEPEIYTGAFKSRKRNIKPHALAASIATIMLGSLLYLTQLDEPVAKEGEQLAQETAVYEQAKLAPTKEVLLALPKTHVVVKGGQAIERLNGLDEYWARHSAASVGRRLVDIQVVGYPR